MTGARIGIVLVGVGDLSGGGGAERFFADLAAAYHSSAASRAHDVWLIIDSQALARLAAVGRTPDPARVIVLSANGEGRFGMLRQLWQLATGGHFALLHVTQALPRHLPWLAALRWRKKRAAICLNVNDYEVTARLVQAPAARGIDFAWRTYLAWFSAPALDGVMVWYRALAAALATAGVVAPVVRAIRHCFVDTARFVPRVKENLVVHAGRLVDVKRPMLFIDAVAEARRRSPALVSRWRFVLLGKGPLREALMARRGTLGLVDVLAIEHASDTSDWFGRAKLFVSTQDHENFTSLSMLEAMACGNAVLARNVGQTTDFVREGRNGLLANDDTPATLATRLLTLLGDETALAAYGAESRRITLDEHCAENLLAEFDNFWHDVLVRRR